MREQLTIFVQIKKQSMKTTILIIKFISIPVMFHAILKTLHLIKEYTRL